MLRLSMFEGFSEASKRILRAAQEEARRSGHASFSPEHILLGMLRERSSAVATYLHGKGLNLRDTRWEVEKLLGRSTAAVPPDISFNHRAKAVMATAREVAGPGRESEPHHLLLGLLREQEGPLLHLLDVLGLDVGEMHGEMMGKVERLRAAQMTAQVVQAQAPPEVPVEASPPVWTAQPREERQVVQYRWAPGGQRVLLETVGGLWVFERRALERQNFLGAGQFPCWSPDGRLLTFFRGRELVVWDGPANRTEVIDDQAIPRFERPWSPDGSFLAFVKLNNLMLWHSDTRQVKLVTSLTGARLAQFEWLPTGDMISYLHNNNLWLVSLDGSDARPFLP